MALKTQAMLVTLNIAQWTARKHDKAVSAEVERAHAAKDAGRFNKQLIDKAHLQPMDKVENALRTYHYKMTLPWGDNGERLLPSRLYAEYTREVRKFKAEFNAAVLEFVRIYPTLVQDARKRLGMMYEPKDYPQPHEIASRFDVSLSYSPVPDAEDFRVDVGAEEVEEIKASITAAVTSRQKAALDNAWQRTRDIVSKIESSLGDKDKVFRDTLINNARELIDLLPGLNITNDPELTEVANLVRAQLLQSPARLRSSPTLRADTAAAASAILTRMGAPA